jgi:hypothetical protein
LKALRWGAHLLNTEATLILQTSFAKQIETIVTLAGTVDLRGARNCVSVRDLAQGYRRFLNRLGQRALNVSAVSPEFVNDRATARTLSGLFSNDSLLDDKAQCAVIEILDDDEADGKRTLIREAMRCLAKGAPELYCIFSTIITDILVRPSAVAKGGSTSQAIGVMWLNPKPSYSVSDVAEILVHEMTHHAMFLDELRYSHYNYTLLFSRATWTTSAILRVPRPLDKVLHSIVVAVEVLLFRQHVCGHPANPRVHPPSRTMIDQLCRSILSTEEAVARNAGAFHPRASELLRNAKSALEELIADVASSA